MSADVAMRVQVAVATGLYSRPVVPDADTLPFLVVHGAVVWKLGLGVLVALVVATIAIFRRRAATRAARAAMRELDSRPGDGVVRGKLGGSGDAPLVTTLTANHQRIDHRASEVWIDTGEGRVVFAGAIRVVAGSSAQASRNGVPAATPDALVDGTRHRRRPFWSAKITTARLASLASGDDVVAVGRLVRTASDEPSEYRVARSALTLHAVDAKPIEIAARQPRAAVARLAAPLAVFAVASTWFVGWGLARSAGEAWRHACWDSPEVATRDAPLAISNGHACALAAAMPESRDNALERLLELLDGDPYRDEASLRQLISLADVVDGCDGVLLRQLRYERYDDAVAEAARCGQPRARYEALVSAGRFAEASAIHVGPDEDIGESSQEHDVLPNAPTLILAGRWPEAAAAVDRRAEAIASRDREPSTELTALSYKCLAELLRHDGGDAAAAGRLRAFAAGEHGVVCLPELSEIASDDERRELFSLRHGGGLPGTRAILGPLAWPRGLADHTWETTSAETLLSEPDNMTSARAAYLIWLARLAPELSADAKPLERAKRSRWLTAAHVLDGDLAAAADSARTAVSEAARDPEGAMVLPDTPLLPAIVALYTPSTAMAVSAGPADVHPMWSRGFGHLLLRHRDPIDDDLIARENYKPALAKAEQGDGALLARELGAGSLQSWTDSDVMAVLPQITAGRDAVVRQLVWSRPSWSGIDFVFPWGTALHAVARRSVLELAGQHAEAARWDVIYRRFDAALRDRRKLVALMLWDL